MKRLDVGDPDVFNKWRSLYYELTHEENIQFGYDMEAKYPHQASFDVKPFQKMFDRVGADRISVVEIGGWKGELAKQIFSSHGGMIHSWFNIDMCKAATEKTVDMTGIPYSVRFPDSFDWFKHRRDQPFDVCVSAHTLEHLTGKDVLTLLDWMNLIPVVMLEIPISEEGQSWDGYEGTHILEFGWKRIREEMEKRHYNATKITDWAYCFERWR